MKSLKSLLISLSLIFIATFIGLYIYHDNMDKRISEQIKDKYGSNNTEANLMHEMNIVPGSYEYIKNYEKQSKESNDIFRNRTFSKNSKTIKIECKKLKYYSYFILNDGEEYVTTTIRELDITSKEDYAVVLKVQAPISNQFREFINQNFSDKEKNSFLEIYPFKNEDKVLIIDNLRYDFFIVDSINKSMVKLEHSGYHDICMDLDKNVLKMYMDNTLTRYTYVYDEFGNLLGKY